MAGKGNSKLRLLYVLDILKKYSDEQNPLNSADIIDKLSLSGIDAERKTIYDDISLLELYGYDIIKTGSPKKGWFLGSREFEEPEIHLLCDAVSSAGFISPKKTRELLHKLTSMLSIRQKSARENAIFFSFSDKTHNEEIYYSIDKISEAISNKRQIELVYSSRYLDNNRTIVKNQKEMVINPYSLAWQDDHYYLIGNHAKYDNLIHLRLDRISAVKLLKTPARHFSEVSSYKDFFDTADYTKKLFSMYGGELEEIELCCNKSIIERVLDRFSENIFIKNVTEDSFNFNVKAAVSPALVTWLMNYGSDITVIKPDSLREMIKKRALDILENYGNFGEKNENEKEKTS